MPVDLGNILFAFTVFLSLITMTSKGAADKGEMIRTSLANPCLDAVALGLLMSLTGLGHALITQLLDLLFTLDLLVGLGKLHALLDTS